MSHKYDLTITTPDPLEVEVPNYAALAELNEQIEATEDAEEREALEAARDEVPPHTVIFSFKRKLTRQQRLMMFIQLGEGEQARQVPDLVFLWKHTIDEVVGLDALQMKHVQCKATIKDGKFIAAILDHPETPNDLVDPVTEYVIDQNIQSADEGNA